MGFPYGLDEDAAFMVTWLELHKLGGIQKLAQLSKKMDKKFKGSININDINNKSINLRKTSLLMKGPTLFDYLYEKNRKLQFSEIVLENCLDPIFVIPLAEKLSKKINFINAYWLDTKNIVKGINISKNKFIIGRSKNDSKILKDQVILQFNKSNKKNNWKYNIRLNNITQKINNTIELKRLEESMKPKSIYWNIISKLAERTFVPSSKISRNKGAGGGDDND